MAKILLVEDDKSLREIYGVRLMAEGYEIVSAGDGEEALAMAIKERPNLIVSDVMMPKISGFDMLDILRSTTETKDVKVIMMTALSSDDQRARGEALGADRYLVKSQVGIEDVVRTVHDVLGDSIAPAAPIMPTFGPAAPTLSSTSVTQTATPTITAPVPAQPAQPAQAPAPAPTPFPTASVAPAPAPAQEVAPAPEQILAPTPEPAQQPVADPNQAQAPAPAPTGYQQPSAAYQAPSVTGAYAAPDTTTSPSQVSPSYAEPASAYTVQEAQPAPAEQQQPQEEQTQPMFVPATEQQPQVQPQAAPEVTLPEMHSSQILFSPEPVAENPAGSQVLSELPSPSNQPATNVAAPASSMPQPTAPFSSPAPASLGERVIEPLTNPASPFQANDIASQIAQELDAHNNSQTPPASPMV